MGFLNILNKAEVKNKVSINEDYIEFDSSLLENFNNYYFYYFMDEYDISNRITNSIDYSLRYIKAHPDKIKDSAKKLKRLLKAEW